jgi:hypothetical protein
MVAFFTAFGYTENRNCNEEVTDMNAFSVIAKLLTAAAAIAGAVFVVVVYGDKIVSYINKLLGRADNRCECVDSDFVDDSDLVDDEVVAAEQDFEEA